MRFEKRVRTEVLMRWWSFTPQGASYELMYRLKKTMLALCR